MVLFFYNLALLLALAATAPWWLWKMATTHKYRQGLWERLGRVPSRLRSDGKPAIWLHAVSVGEVLAVSRLVGELERVFPGHRLLISTTTRTGQDLARQRFGAERVFYCPLDLPWAVWAYLKAIRPRMLVLTETEFWPNLLDGCFLWRVPVAVVNARISDRSWPRYRRLRWLWSGFLRSLARVLAQTETDAERLRALGCRPERVTVAGNLKFDVRAAEESEAVRLLRAASDGLRLFVAGSTLEGEEAALLEAWPEVLATEPRLAMVLVPRHPERFAAVAALLEEKAPKLEIAWRKRSEWKSAGKPLAPGEIVLLDTIGELASVYSLASVAFVGGSLIPAGGHNPLEPAQFGVPIIMGQHYTNFRAITYDLLAHEALRILGRESVAATVIELLQDRAAAAAMGARARQVFDEQAGATARCVFALRKLIRLPIAPDIPIDPDILKHTEQMKARGASMEAILAFLRDKKLDKIDSIHILCVVLGLSNASAKELVHRSTVWRDRLDADNELHRQLWEEVERASKEPNSGIKIEDSDRASKTRKDHDV